MRKSKDYLPKLLEYIELANKIPNGYSFLTYDEIINLSFDRNNGVASPKMIIEIYRFLCSLSFYKPLSGNRKRNGKNWIRMIIKNRCAGNIKMRFCLFKQANQKEVFTT